MNAIDRTWNMIEIKSMKIEKILASFKSHPAQSHKSFFFKSFIVHIARSRSSYK